MDRRHQGGCLVGKLLSAEMLALPVVTTRQGLFLECSHMEDHPRQDVIHTVHC